jgi:hypothetical protein
MPAHAPLLASTAASAAEAPTGREALAAQFDRHGHAARQAERDALARHLHAAASQPA